MPTVMDKCYQVGYKCNSAVQLIAQKLLKSTQPLLCYAERQCVCTGEAIVQTWSNV